MTYSPNPLRHNPNAVGGLYCFICKTPCTEQAPCACEETLFINPSLGAGDLETLPEPVTPEVAPPKSAVRHVGDTDAGEAGDDSA